MKLRLLSSLLLGLLVVVASCRLLRPKEPTRSAAWRKESPTIPSRILGMGGSASGDVLFACGEQGLLLRSSDAGKTWIVLSSNTKNHLSSIWQSISGDVFAVGASGVLLRSSDDGASWQGVQTNLQESLYDIRGVKRSATIDEPSLSDLPERLLAVGVDGTILASDDGLSWASLYSGTQRNLHAIWEDEQSVYIAGELGTLLVSSDHGVSWDVIETGTQHTLRSGYSDVSELLLAGDRVALEKSAGGFLPIANESGIVWGQDGSVFAAFSGRLLARPDDAAGWLELWSSQQEEIEGLWGRAADELYFWTNNGSVYRHKEGDTSLQSMHVNEDLYGVFSSQRGTISIGDYGTILQKKKDKWERQTVHDDPSQKLYDFWEEPGGLRLIVGEQGILSSAFEDESWRREYDSPDSLYGIFGDASVGIFAVGDSGLIVKTTDAGAAWEQVPLESTMRADLFSGLVTPSGEIFLVGADAFILWSQDLGRTFERIWLPRVDNFDVKDLFSIERDPDGTLWIGGWGHSYFRDSMHNRKERPDAIIWRIPRGDFEKATMTTLETWSMARAVWRGPNQRLFVVTKRSVVSTKDGINWDLEIEDGGGLTAIGGDKSRLYVVGLDGTIWSK